VAKAQAISHGLIALSQHHLVASFPGLFQFATCTFQSFRDKDVQRFELPLISLETFSRHTLCELG
jgi:hypothetical protein